MSKLDGIEVVGPYQAQYIVTPPEDLPEGCVLPEELPSPALPPLEFPEIPLECEVDLDIPLVPTPPVPCIPATYGISSITTCNNIIGISGEQLQIVPANSLPPLHPSYDADSCDFVLIGSLELCGCNPSFSGAIAVTVGSGVTSGGSVTLSKVGDCSAALSGTLSICQPTFSGSISVSEGESTGGSINLVSSGSCGAMLSGSITIGPTGGSTPSVDSTPISTGDGCELTNEELPRIELTEETVPKLKLGGLLPIPCFDCSDLPGPDLPFQFKSIELYRLALHEELSFNSSCNAGLSFWNDKGGKFRMQTELLPGGGMVYMDVATIIGKTAQFRLWNFCVNGEAKRVYVLATEFFD